jgi:glycerol uptake facilitator protein
MTVAFAAFRGFPARKVPGYVAAQLLGAFLGAVVLYLLYGNVIAAFEAKNAIVRGQPGSELSAMVYGEYFPNPALAKGSGWEPAAVSLFQAALAEGVGTALLAFFVFAVTDSRNSGGPGSKLAPAFIGLAVSIIISIVAPLTQAGLNPARDFAPRVFAWLAGWGSVAIPGPRGGFFTVYILAPVIGATVGAFVYQVLLHARFAEQAGMASSTLTKSNQEAEQCEGLA